MLTFASFAGFCNDLLHSRFTVSLIGRKGFVVFVSTKVIRKAYGVFERKRGALACMGADGMSRVSYENHTTL